MASTTAAYGEALLPRPPTAEEPLGAASGGEGAGLVSGSDGADDAKDYGTLLPPTKQASNRDISAMRVTWEDWSDPWWLLLYTASEVGSILFALMCMFIMVWMKRRFCMACDKPGLEMWEMCLCEYTKSYVRLFPLIALVVTLAVASRALLRRHFFYQMLKHGVLVRLENRAPLKDPLFHFLIWCLLHALSHFLMGMRSQIPMSISDTVEYLTEVKMATFYYMSPAILFMCFLWSSYDVENTLVPLSKFVASDNEQACGRLASTMIITEGNAHIVATQGLLLQDPGSGSHQAHDLCLRLAESTQQLVADRQSRMSEYRCRCGAVLLAGGGECASCARHGWAAEYTIPAGMEPSERSDIIKSWWIADLMLDIKLSDEDSRKFRNVWYIFAVVSLLTVPLVAGTFWLEIASHASQMLDDHHLVKAPTFCALCADLLHLCVVLRVEAGFLWHLWQPLREVAKDKVSKAVNSSAGGQ